MREWLTIEWVVGALLVTSFTCTGLLALWAATSRRHWFLRAFALLLALSPLLAVPAPEPFLTFGLEVSVILAGAMLWPFVKRVQFVSMHQPVAQTPTTKQNTPSSILRFFLRALLLASPMVVVLALVAPFFALPWYAPAILYGLVSGVIVAGVVLFLAIWKGWGRVKRLRMHIQPKSFAFDKAIAPGVMHHMRFSLRTLLLLTPVVAIVAAMGAQVAIHLGPQTYESITTILLDGLICGITVLLAAWMTVTNRRKIVWPIAVSVCLGLAALAAWFDWLLPSLVLQETWPPQSAFAVLGLRQTHPQFAWLVILPAMLLVVFLVIISRQVSSSSADHRSVAGQTARWMARVALVLSLVILAAFPAYTLWELLHPLPLPKFTMPVPNGIEKIVAAGAVFDNSPILSTLVEPKSTAELAAEVAKHQSAYDELHLALTQEFRVQVWPRKEELLASFNASLNIIQTARSAARGLMREAELARQQGRLDDAARIAYDQIRFGIELPRDGLLVDYLVGIAIEGMGHYSLFQLVRELDQDQCHQAITKLIELEQIREPLELVLHRDRVWSQHAYGWSGHLMQILDDIVPQSNTPEMVRQALNRTSAISRLLAVELAIRGYTMQHGQLPAILDDLIPDQLTQIPLDPFSPAGEGLLYLRTENSYFLYSVGQDGIDNGGSALPGSVGLYEREDLLLDAFFTRDSEPTGAIAESDDKSADNDDN